MSSVSEGVPFRCEARSGLIVETVTPGSAALQAGLQPRDRLVSYDSKPLSSPAALLALEENTFGKEQVLLQIEREGAVLERFVPIGMLGVEVRPQLPSALSARYEAGRERFQSGAFVEAAQQWQEAAEQSSDAAIAAWLYGTAGAAWKKVTDWEQAIGAYQKGWELLEGRGDTAAQSQVLTMLGRCHQNRSEWEAAIGWYERAGQRDQEAGREMWEALSLQNLGVVAWKRGDLEAAQGYHTRALQIRERLAPDSLQVAMSLSNLGLVTWNRGDLEAAQDYYTRALKIQERLAPNSTDVAKSLIGLGNVAAHRGDLEAAQDYYTRALKIQERLAPYSPDVAMSLNNLGSVALQGGDLEAAQDYYLRALRIDERLAPNSLDVAHSLNNLGVVAYYRSDLDATQDYHTRAFQIYERLAPNSLHVAASLGNLGLVALIRGDLDAARDYFTHDLQITERLAPDSLTVAISLNNLGIVARDREDLQAAQDYHIRALKIRERLAPNSLDVAMSLNNLGSVAHLRGDFEVAQDYQTRALKIRERLAPDSLDYASYLNNLGRTLLLSQRPNDALPHLQHAVQILETQRSTIASPEARALLLAQHTAKYASLIQCHLALNQNHEAFSILEQSRARSLLELLAERRLDFTTQAPPHLLQQQQDLDRQRAHTYDQLAKLSDTQQDQPEIDALHTTLRELQRRQQELTAQIRLASPQFAALQYPQPLDFKAAQSSLDSGTLLLSYLVDEEQTFLFALTSKILHCFTLPLGRKSLQEQVQQWREALDLTSIENSLPQAITQGKALYDLLLAPAAVQIQRAKRLLLCPDGPLHSLPWPALVTNAGKSPRYLGQFKPLHTTLSMTIYAQTREEARGKRQEKQTTAQPTDASTTMGLTSQLLQAARRLLALGDPVYSGGLTPAFARSGGSPQRALHDKEESAGEPDSSILHTTVAPNQDRELASLCTRGLSLARLPYSREEVETIGQLFAEQAVVKVGEEATKTAALTESAEADIVHFACHGWLDGHDPLSSGLVFSQPEALGEAAVEGDNGLLQAWEIFSKLRLKAELVVLSACQTGLGQEVRGEGLIGLTRAFQYAGAQSVLVSLWEVSDASTSVFMQAFYEQLKVGTGKAEALQAAIQQLSSHPRWQHPFFWSAFVLQGDAG